MSPSKRLSIAELNNLFIQGLGDAVLHVEDQGTKPFLADVQTKGSIIKLRVYLYNCTNPPGGRASNEYKAQIIVPEQKRGERGNFDYSGDRIVIFGAFTDYGRDIGQGVFILYDPMCHIDFAYSTNVQVKDSFIAPALAHVYWEDNKSNGETVITSTVENLLYAVERRIEVVSPALMK